MATLEIKDLHASVVLDDETTKPILKGVNLTIRSGEGSLGTLGATVRVVGHLEELPGLLARARD